MINEKEIKACCNLENDSSDLCDTIQELLIKEKKCPEWAFDHAWNIYNNIQGLIKAVDQKAYVSSTLSLIVATIVLFAAPELFKIQSIFVKLILFAFAGSTINFIRLALSTLHARSKSSEDQKSFNQKAKDFSFNLLSSLNIKMKKIESPEKTVSLTPVLPSLIFFLDISEHKSSEYVQSFLKITSEESIKDLFGQIHEISGIAKEKCHHYNLSSYALRIQLFFFMIIMLMLMIL